MKQIILLIDLDRCIGCRGGCQVACKTAHGIALGPSRSKLWTMGPTGVFPKLEMYFIPVMCQQCEKPACVKVCPTGARYKGDDGIIHLERGVCVGCRICDRACPYETNIFNHELHVMDKCDICSGLREKGEEPVCARNCAGSAIYWGDVNDPESEVSRRIAEAGADHVFALADSGGVLPSCRFILRNAKWIDTLPHKFVRTTRQETRHV